MIGNRGARSGFTLAELMVVIMILGVMAAVTGIAFATKTPTPTPVADARHAQVAGARDSAVRSGQRVTVKLDVDGALHLATAFPDGRVVSDESVAVDPLSGRSVRATR